MSEFSTYQRFFTIEDAQPTLALLKQHHIEYKFAEPRRTAGGIIANEVSATMYELQIRVDQFEPVDTLLRENITINLDDLDKDHYLFAFTDEELTAILQKPDEWGKQDYLLAIKLLERRGITYTEQELASLKKNRLRELAEPEKEGKGWIISGYIFAFVSGIIGVMIGLGLWQATKTLPNGRKVYAYSHNAREQGKIIVAVALVLTLANAAIRLARGYGHWLDLFSTYSYF